MTQGEAQGYVNGAALVVGAIYFYRKLIEPAAGAGASASPAPTGSLPAVGDSSPRAVFDRYRGPQGSFSGFSTFNEAGEPTTISGAAAQLLGEGKPPSTERFVVGWGFVFLTLSLGVSISPQLAGSFAALVALGSILTNGSQVSKDLRTQLRRPAPDPTVSQSSLAASPTTFVSFAGAAGQSGLMPEGSQRKKKSTKPNSKLESA